MNRDFRPKYQRRRLRRAAGAGAAALLLSVVAWAATFQHSAQLKTEKSPEHVLHVLTAYDDTCDSGCRYSRPSLIRVAKLTYKATPTRWYTWSHVGSAIKDAKYFTEVTVEKRADGHFTTENRQLDKDDKALIEVLEKKTGLKHAPVFDGGSTKTTTHALSDKTVVSQVVTVHTGAVVGLWAGKIREEMEKNVAATFRNIEK